jgi:hypothetical protein
LLIKLSSFLILVLDFQVQFHPLDRHSSLMSPQADIGTIYFFSGTPLPNSDQSLLIYGVSRSHSVRHASVRRTPLDEWSSSRRDLTTHNTHNRQTPVSQVRTHNLSGEQQQTNASGRAASKIKGYNKTSYYFKQHTCFIFLQ